MILLHKIDNLLNLITMYGWVLYILTFFSVVAIILGFLGYLPFSGSQFILSLAVILISVFVSNYLFAKITNADTNIESFWITGFILFLILAPIMDSTDLMVTVLISVVAMASKYFLTFDKKHIFNPAAIGLFLAGLFGFGNSIWWVGSAILFPLVLICGLLVVRKIRRFQLFFVFSFFALITVCIFNYFNGLSTIETIYQVITSWPLIFFGTIMLTEPFTTPYNKTYRNIYGSLIGILFGSQFSFGPIYSSPELSLVVGNIFSFFINPKGKLLLDFKQMNKLAPTIFEFVFKSNRNLNFIPGQYLEWTQPHKNSDLRGIRRFFTISSAPGEDIKIGVKILPKSGSSFKKNLLNLKPGNALTADQLSGDFILPENPAQKFIFIAGGIGITPFRSMIQDTINKGEKRNILLFYCASDTTEFVYKNIFEKAQEFGVKTVYVLGGKDQPLKNWEGETGYLTDKTIKKYSPDFKDRIYYLSGPISMVNNYKNLLSEIGINHTKIVTDYFPGF